MKAKVKAKQVPQIIIRVEGGIIQDVVSNSKIDVLVYDVDNIKDDYQAFDRDGTCVEVGVGRYKKFKAEMEAMVIEEQKFQADDSDVDEPANDTGLVLSADGRVH